MGVLNLISAYDNMNGFISFTKMGFNKNLYLYNKDSIVHHGLPMSVDLCNINNETIFKRATENETRIVTKCEDPSYIYNFIR